ncbi:MAG TPA: potassium transporter Kup [Kofleriaceae bacterium]|nr:potassium transporter Kup [Kofleriaceae bacterium]
MAEDDNALPDESGTEAQTATEDVTIPPPMAHGHGGHGHGHGENLAKLSLGALGVVYGDIGTSPLYALAECFHGTHAVAINSLNVFGVLSLVFWALMLVIVVKYLSFIMRADNKGEGGILALAALVMGTARARRVSIIAIPVLMGLFGAGLLYGEGLITPAISILGALDGLKVATTKLEPLIVPITAVILVGLFAVQRYGTGRIGSIFGWIMLVWFVSIAAAGIHGIVIHPGVLAAVSPHHAVRFFLHDPTKAFFLLGSVVLVVTGAEALYADMGHFGRKPIRLAWFSLVMPSLLLNYFGQGALLLSGSTAKNPFYALTPGIFLYPMLVLATLAAIIASQALISGAFSLTRAAVQLGYFPRVRIVHTSGDAEGQIYIPEINWMLLIACLALVFAFRSAGALAAAYGISVTGTMMISSVLFYHVATGRWGWRRLTAGALVTAFLCIDVPLFTANLEKLSQGGWFPLAVGLMVFTIMTTWRRGRTELGEKFKEATLPEDLFLDDLRATQTHRVQGTAVFMTSTAGGIPPVLLHHLKHNKVLHKQVVLLSISSEQVPMVPLRDNFEVTDLGQGFYRVTAHYGFMQTPKVPRLLARCAQAGLQIDPNDTSYYLGRETLLVGGASKMARWRKALFSFLSRNSRPATAFFHLPPNRVVELGAQIEL